MQKICKTCGSQLSPDILFCEQCGTRIVDDEKALPVEESPPESGEDAGEEVLPESGEPASRPSPTPPVDDEASPTPQTAPTPAASPAKEEPETIISQKEDDSSPSDEIVPSATPGIVEKRKKWSLRRLLTGGRPTGWQLSQFFRQMSVLTDAGISIVRSLEICRKQTSEPLIQEGIDRLLFEIRAGTGLSGAMERAGGFFTKFHVGTIKGAEIVGEFKHVFNNLADWEEKDYHLKQRLKTIMIYPTFIIIFSFIGILFLVRFLLPLIKSVTERSGHEPPWPTKFLMVIGRVMEEPLLLVCSIIIVTCLIYLVRWLFTKPKVKIAWDAFKFKVPFFGSVLRSSMVVIVSRSMASLLESELPITRTLDLTGACCGSIYLKEKIFSIAVNHVRQGESLSQALSDYKIFPRSFHGMIAVGEKTGTLPSILKGLADIHEIETNVRIEIAMRSIEPIIIALVGGVVLLVMLCAFLPLYDILKGVGT